MVTILPKARNVLLKWTDDRNVTYETTPMLLFHCFTIRKRKYGKRNFFPQELKKILEVLYFHLFPSILTYVKFFLQ